MDFVEGDFQLTMPDDSAAGLKHPIGKCPPPPHFSLTHFLGSDMDELATTFSSLAVVYLPRTSRTLLEMPDDLLYQLFTSILPPHPADALLTAVKLSHVCTNWRAIIINAPVLWMYVDMPITRKRRHTHVVESFLRRSQQLSLDFHIRVRADADPVPLHVVEAISLHSHRFHALSVLVHPRSSLNIALDAVSAMDLPLIQHFDLAVVGQQQCSLTMQPRSSAGRFQNHLIIPHSPIPYLDWSIRTFNLTSLSLKYMDISAADLLTVLILAQFSLRHLEVYSDYRDVCPNFLPCITLPHLGTIRIGYRRADVLCRIVDRLILPNLYSASVHDFGRCPERTTPSRYRDTHFKSVIAQEKDASKLLVAMCPFRNLTHLKLRGVLCPSTPFESLILPLQYLFEGLSSLHLLKSDPEFMLALVDVTSVCSMHGLRNLTELSTTCEEYALVMEYLALRSARGLPRLRRLSVNPKISLLRHFYKEYAEEMRVLGRYRVVGPPDFASTLYTSRWRPVRDSRFS